MIPLPGLPPGWIAPFGPDSLRKPPFRPGGVAPSTEGIAGTGAAPGSFTDPTTGNPSGITGFSPSLVGLALSSLAAVPGSPFGMASKGYGLANSLGAMPNQNMVNEQGFPVNYEGPRNLTGLLGSLMGLGKSPNFTVTPIDEMGIPGMSYSHVTDRSGETTAMGLGAQAAFNALAASLTNNTPFSSNLGNAPHANALPGARTGHVDPSDPTGMGPVGFTGMGVPGIAEAMSDTPGVEGSGDGGGGGGGGGSHLCTLMHEYGAMDVDTWVANGRFRARMSQQERRGYDLWAKPFTRWLRTHRGAFWGLHSLLGWIPRAYMQEIRVPGSSRLGRAILTGGLWGCRWLGSRA